jgi:hypothetical protein
VSLSFVGQVPGAISVKSVVVNAMLPSLLVRVSVPLLAGDVIVIVGVDDVLASVPEVLLLELALGELLLHAVTTATRPISDAWKNVFFCMEILRLESHKTIRQNGA